MWSHGYLVAVRVIYAFTLDKKESETVQMYYIGPYNENKIFLDLTLVWQQCFQCICQLFIYMQTFKINDADLD